MGLLQLRHERERGAAVSNKIATIAFGLCFALALYAAGHTQQIGGGGSSSGSGSSPGGSNKSVQYNDSSAFGGGTNLTWDKTSNVLNVNGVSVFGSTVVGDLAANLAIVGMHVANSVSGQKDWAFVGDGNNSIKFQRWTDGFGAPAATVWSVDNSVTSVTLNMLGPVVMNPGSDATHTDATMCIDSSSGLLYKGSGTLGICLGTSSARFKTDISPLQAGLVEVMALEPISYRYLKGFGDGDRPLYGFTAEQVVNVLPQLTAPDKDQKPNSVDMLGMIPVLVRAIQEQQAEIEQLKKQR